MELINGRWRGRMPFRTDIEVRKQLDQLRRTGEPSPAEILTYWDFIDSKRSLGWSRARGSFTETMRQALWKWMETTYGSNLHPLTFQYRLHRHKIVTIVGDLPWIKHDPIRGKGHKGFALDIYIMSIDGVQYKRRTTLAWNRIVGKEKFLYLNGVYQ